MKQWPHPLLLTVAERQAEAAPPLIVLGNRVDANVCHVLVLSE